MSSSEVTYANESSKLRISDQPNQSKVPRDIKQPHPSPTYRLSLLARETRREGVRQFGDTLAPALTFWGNSLLTSSTCTLWSLWVHGTTWKNIRQFGDILRAREPIVGSTCKRGRFPQTDCYFWHWELTSWCASICGYPDRGPNIRGNSLLMWTLSTNGRSLLALEANREMGVHLWTPGRGSQLNSDENIIHIPTVTLDVRNPTRGCTPIWGHPGQRLNIEREHLSRARFPQIDCHFWHWEPTKRWASICGHLGKGPTLWENSLRMTTSPTYRLSLWAHRTQRGAVRHWEHPGKGSNFKTNFCWRRHPYASSHLWYTELWVSLGTSRQGCQNQEHSGQGPNTERKLTSDVDVIHILTVTRGTRKPTRKCTI